MKRLLVATVAAAALLAPSAAWANHSWGNYHWARTSNPFTLKLGDNMTGDWKPRLAKASTDWSRSSVLDTTVVAGQAKGKNCRPSAGRVEVCNGRYGNNGWLGIAQIWLTGSHITQGSTRMNDSYLSSGYTNTNKQHVICQEVGHTFGLDHQSESGADLNTCMDYDVNLSNPTPNQHDYDQLVTIYSHLDSTSTVGARSPSSRFVERLGPNRLLVTYVRWASPFRTWY